MLNTKTQNDPKNYLKQAFRQRFEIIVFAVYLKLKQKILYDL